MKIRYVNYRKKFSNISKSCFDRLFYIERRWENTIINIGVYHYALILDFRKNWIKDMMNCVKEKIHD